MGREYLTSLRENAVRQRERQTRARAISFQMHRLFNPLDEEVSCRLTESGKMVLDIAHLIDRKCVERYQNKFATTSATLRDCQMQVSGPWPPYHFVHRLTRGASDAGGRCSCSGRRTGKNPGTGPRDGLGCSRLSLAKSPGHAGAFLLLRERSIYSGQGRR